MIYDALIVAGEVMISAMIVFCGICAIDWFHVKNKEDEDW